MEAYRSHQRTGRTGFGARSVLPSSGQKIHQPTSSVTHHSMVDVFDPQRREVLCCGVLRVTSKFGALALAAGIDATILWLPSKRNLGARHVDRLRGTVKEVCTSPRPANVSINAAVRRSLSGAVTLVPLAERQATLPVVTTWDTNTLGRLAQSRQQDPRANQPKCSARCRSFSKTQSLKTRSCVRRIKASKDGNCGTVAQPVVAALGSRGGHPDGLVGQKTPADGVAGPLRVPLFHSYLRTCHAFTITPLLSDQSFSSKRWPAMQKSTTKPRLRDQDELCFSTQRDKLCQSAVPSAASSAASSRSPPVALKRLDSSAPDLQPKPCFVLFCFSGKHGKAASETVASCRAGTRIAEMFGILTGCWCNTFFEVAC